MPYFLILLIYLLPTQALAFDPKQFSTIPNTGSSSDSQIYQGLSTKDAYANTLDKIILWMLVIGGLLAFSALLFGAGQYLLAAGDEQKATIAKKTITYAILGVVLVMLLFVIIEFVIRGEKNIPGLLEGIF